MKRKLRGDNIARPQRVINEFGTTKEPFLQNAIVEFIKSHPNCTRKDLYSLPHAEGDIRKALLKVLRQHRVKETFTIV